MKYLMMLCAALLLCANVAFAVPNTLNFQGQLFLNGSPTTGPVSIIFRIYDAETNGTVLWTETDNVTVTNGLFSTVLGDGTEFPSNLFDGSDRWIEMETNSQVLNPRVQLHAVPYAMQSQRADTADVALSGTGGDLWSTDGTNVWRVSGNVGIGTTSPTHALETHSTAPGQVGFFHSTSTTGTNYGIDAGAQGIGATTNIGGYFYASGATNNYAIIVPPGFGNVGIGTTSPSTKLHLVHSTTVAEFEEQATRGLVRFKDQTTTNSPHIGSTGDDFTVLTGPATTEKFRITSDGNLGVNVTSPLTAIHAVRTSGVSVITAIDPSTNSNTFGIYGETASQTNGISPGSPGAGSAVGVFGRTTSNTSTGGGTLGILGRNDANTTSGDIAAGVFGWAPGVSSGSPTQFDGIVAGVIGESWSRNASGAGVIGFNESPEGNTRGVWGEVKSSTGRGVYGRNPSGSGYAGWFDGNLHVAGGNFTLSGGTKMAVVPTSQGMTELYCQESPEVWFEDFGEGQLDSGRIRIELDPLFLETVRVSDDHPIKVFVTLNDDCGGVYVKRSTASFEVMELGGGSSNARFSYRVVAKRRGYEDYRLKPASSPASSN